jgi:hypothetical protein
MKLFVIVAIAAVLSYSANVALSTTNEWIEVYSEHIGTIAITYSIAANAVSNEDEKGYALVASKVNYNLPLVYPVVNKEVSAVYYVNRLNCRIGTARIVADSGTDNKGAVVFTDRISRLHREAVPDNESGLGQILQAYCSIKSNRV